MEVLIGVEAVERERGGRMLEDRLQQGDELLVKWLLFSSRASWMLGFGFKVRRFRQLLQIRHRFTNIKSGSLAASRFQARNLQGEKKN